MRVIAAGRGAFGGFVDRGTERLAHLEGHHLGVELFFALENFGGFQHGLAALGKSRLSEADERILRALELLVDLRVGERVKCLNHFSGSRIGGGDGHGWFPLSFCLSGRDKRRGVPLALRQQRFFRLAKQTPDLTLGPATRQLGGGGQASHCEYSAGPRHLR